MVMIPDLMLGGVTNVSSLRFDPLINTQPPGGFDTGSIAGIVNDILQRIPLPRNIPRPQLPPAPGGGTGRGPTRFPIPIPIPLPGGLFSGDNGGCAPNPCCRGQHLNKTMGCDGAPAGTKCVSNRRMNVTNMRALKRGIRRLKGFERVVVGSRKALRSLSKI